MMNQQSSLSNLFSLMFKSRTISPNYQKAHIIHALLLLGDDDFGIGRYRIMKELNLGEGSIKTMLARFQEGNLIKAKKYRQQGHILTQKGKKLQQQILQYVSKPELMKNDQNQYVVGKKAVFSIIPKEHLKDTIEFGIPQRDEAIKIGANGATCVVFNGTHLVFPNSNEYLIKIPELKNKTLKKGDIVLIGGGDNEGIATLGLIAAALSIIQF